MCGDCYAESMPAFLEIKDFLHSNPGANALQIAEAMRSKGLKITSGDVIEFVHDGRIDYQTETAQKQETFKKIATYRPNRYALG